MDLGTVFLILDQSLEANRDTLVLVRGGDFVDAYILDARSDNLVVEVKGVPFEARPWREGDATPPLHPHGLTEATCWTVYGIEGQTQP